MLRTRVRTGVIATCALLLMIGAHTGAKLAAQNTAPTISTDKTGYLLGESVAISGGGFAAGESVSVQVADADGASAYAAIAAQADDDGRVNASWVLEDASARSLTVSAVGDSSGAAEAASFKRVVLIQTDKYDYQLGETVQISGAGFDPSEAVTIQVQHSNDLADGAGHLPFAVAADASGNISAAWAIAEDARDSIFRVTATGSASGLVATTTFTDPPSTFVDSNGVDDVAGPQDLNFYQFENFGELGGAPALALTWGLDDTAFAAGVQACALVDVDGDGNTNRMLCATVDGNPPGVTSVSVFSCSDTGLGCVSPVNVGSFAGSISASTAPADPFGGLHSCVGVGCSTLDTVVNVTMRGADLGLAAGERPNAIVTNVCTDADCALPAGSGFLSIDKQIPPNGLTAPFTFTLGAGQTAQNGQSSWTLTPGVIQGTGASGLIAFAPGTYSVFEQIPAGWQMTSATCRQPSEVIPSSFPIAGPAVAGVQNVPVVAGRLTRCKFTNEVGAPANPAIDLIKFVNGDDANSPTGPVVAIGSTVTFTFQVTNTGDVTLAPVVVTDDVLGAICTIPSLAAGASQTCTATATATAGQHANVGTATGTPPSGGNVSDTDPGHYFGSAPAIDLIKFVNGDDANSPTGPVVAVGSAVTFTFQVTNTGNVTLAPVVVTDNVLGAVCTIASLSPGASQTCSATGTATAGQHANVGTATGTPPVGGNVSDTDPGHYFGSAPAIDLIKFVNGDDANSPTGPVVAVGSAVTFTFQVTNTGNVTLAPVVVTDNVLGAVCTIASLAPGASQTCSATGTATAGQHANVGTATGTPPVGGNVSDTDPGHYFGSAPAIDLIKFVNGDDANVPTGPVVAVGSTVTFTFRVTNTGNVTLAPVVVTDNVLGAVCTIASLAPGASQTCSATAAAQIGQHTNTGTATGTPPVGGNVVDTDPGNYFGASPSIALVKLTNGTDNNSAPGPTVNVGSTVTWTYRVTNTGNVALTNVVVRDDNGTPANLPDDFTVCTIASLAAGASQTCTASRPAILGQYENWATTTGNYGSTVVTAKDPDHYFGRGATIVIKKVTKPTVGGSFNFTVTGSGYSNFTLGGGGTNTQTVLPGTYSVTEAITTGWTLTGIGGSTDINTPYACVVTGSSASSGSGDLATRKATIVVQAGDTVTCTFENTSAGATRTQGYWQTHPALANIVWFGGTFGGKTFPGVAATNGIGNRVICGKDINSLARLMGGFWSNISKTSTGATRTAIDQARMQALQQLLAAELNASAFGTYPAGGPATFASWESQMCSTNLASVQGVIGAAGGFNESGDSVSFTPGAAADPKAAKAVADIPYWNTTKQ